MISTLPRDGAREGDPEFGREFEWAIHAPHYRVPREIRVNSLGERFHAEDDPTPDAFEVTLLAQPGREMWVVFDDAALSAGDSFHGIWDATEIRRRALRGDGVWCAQDPRELAQLAGIAADGFEQTVDEWNEAVRTGVDRLGRLHLEYPLQTPPLYAARARAAPRQTPGGVAVDDQLRVLDGANRPIRGLYAAGEVLGAGAFMGVGKCSGMLVAPAISFGRELGRRLALSQ